MYISRVDVVLDQAGGCAVFVSGREDVRCLWLASILSQLHWNRSLTACAVSADGNGLDAVGSVSGSGDGTRTLWTGGGAAAAPLCMRQSRQWRHEGFSGVDNSGVMGSVSAGGGAAAAPLGLGQPLRWQWHDSLSGAGSTRVTGSASAGSDGAGTLWTGDADMAASLVAGSFSLAAWRAKALVPTSGLALDNSTAAPYLASRSS